MPDDNFSENLMRAAVAYLQTQTTLTVSREMFGKSYFALGQLEKIAVDQAAIGLAASYFQALTRESLSGQPAQAQAAGFLAGMNLPPGSKATADSGTLQERPSLALRPA